MREKPDQGQYEYGAGPDRCTRLWTGASPMLEAVETYDAKRKQSGQDKHSEWAVRPASTERQVLAERNREYVQVGEIGRDHQRRHSQAGVALEPGLADSGPDKRVTDVVHDQYIEPSGRPAAEEADCAIIRLELKGYRTCT